MIELGRIKHESIVEFIKERQLGSQGHSSIEWPLRMTNIILAKQ